MLARIKCTYETVHGGVDLVVNAAALCLAGSDSGINEALVGGLVGRREDERRVGGRILGLVDIDSYAMCVSLAVSNDLSASDALTLEVARVGDNDSAGLLEGVESGGHGEGGGRGMRICRAQEPGLYLFISRPGYKYSHRSSMITPADSAVRTRAVPHQRF